MFLSKKEFSETPPPEFDELSARRISTLQFVAEHTRINNLCASARIVTLGQLFRKKEYEVLKYRNVGKKTLRGIKDTLNQLDVCLGICKYHVGPEELEILKDLDVMDFEHCVHERLRIALFNHGGPWQIRELFPRARFERTLRKHPVLNGLGDTQNPRAYVIGQIETMLEANCIPWA